MVWYQNILGKVSIQMIDRKVTNPESYILHSLNFHWGDIVWTKETETFTYRGEFKLSGIYNQLTK